MSCDWQCLVWKRVVRVTRERQLAAQRRKLRLFGDTSNEAKEVLSIDWSGRGRERENIEREGEGERSDRSKEVSVCNYRSLCHAQPPSPPYVMCY